MNESQRLVPAAELAKKSRTRFPNENDAYREARTALLAEEIDLRRHIQRVAAMRRALPPGGEAKNYRFLDENGREAGLADLFGSHDALLTYFWMYGPERERPCPMCTSFVGSLDIPARDIEQRVALAIVGRASARLCARTRVAQPQILPDHRRRFRSRLPRLPTRRQRRGDGPGLEATRRQGDKVRLFWAAEGGEETADPGFDPHLAPDPTPLWNILDWTPEGRGVDWYPKLDYAEEGPAHAR